MGRTLASRWMPLVLIATLPAGYAAGYASSHAHAADPMAADRTAPVLPESAVGFRKLAVADPARIRALEVAVWYPTDATDRETSPVGDSRIMTGAPLRVEAPPQAGRHRLVVISHGYGGNWNNQQWLAVDLAAQGYVVAAANHPGSTSRDLTPPGAVRLAERPRDVSRVIDALNADPQFSPVLEPQRAVAIGHSLGGWTAMALAGGRFDPARFAASCKAHPEMAACGPEIARPPEAAEAAATLARPLADARIRAVVTLDLGLSQGFDPASLAAVARPVLVIGAGPGNPKMPVELESGHLARLLPAATTRYVPIGDAGHFSFLGICKPGAIALLEAERPGDGTICRDGGDPNGEGRGRPAIHRQVTDLVGRFLNETFR